MQSTDSIETYTYGTSKDLVNEKKEIKSNNIIKLHKRKWLTLMMLQKKTKVTWTKLAINSRSTIQKKKIDNWIIICYPDRILTC